MANGKRAARWLALFSIFHFSFSIFLVGCSSDKHPTTRPASASDRQEAALKDPFDYSPNINEDISGGDIGHLDKKAMKRDLDDVLNP